MKVLKSLKHLSVNSTSIDNLKAFNSLWFETIIYKTSLNFTFHSDGISINPCSF